jgi:ATP-dependent RNA helicase DOB1
MSMAEKRCCRLDFMIQVAGALRGVGELELAGKFDEAIVRIKRDIIFAASLYL